MWLQGIAKRHNWNSFVSNRPYIVHKCTFNNCIFLKWISQKWFFKHFFPEVCKEILLELLQKYTILDTWLFCSCLPSVVSFIPFYVSICLFVGLMDCLLACLSVKFTAFEFVWSSYFGIFLSCFYIFLLSFVVIRLPQVPESHQNSILCFLFPEGTSYSIAF